MKINKGFEMDAAIIRSSLNLIKSNVLDGTEDLTTLEMINFIYSAASRIEKQILGSLKEKQTAKTAAEITGIN